MLFLKLTIELSLMRITSQINAQILTCCWDDDDDIEEEVYDAELL